MAVRDNERAAMAFGLTPSTIKLAILAVSGFLAGVAGVLWADAWRVAAPVQFTPDVSIAAIAIPVVGGLGSLAGAAAAAVMLYMSAFFVGPVVSGVFGNFGHNLGFQLFLAGFSQVTALLQLPSGLAGAVQRGWQDFLDRRADRIEAQRVLLEPAAATPLRVEALRVAFGGVVALDGASLAVGPGEIVGLIGPNGAGKTTLMNVVSGLITPQAGSVRVFGQEISDLPADVRIAYGLARSFQEAALFSSLTVTETIQVVMTRANRVGFASALVGAPWARSAEASTRASASDVIDRMGLGPWADSLVAELSTGTRRICDLAAQVATGCRLLLLDEPTAGIAQRESEAFGPVLRRVRDELDCSILIVEHDMPLLMGLCDRVYAMESGRVIAEGTPEQIRADPLVIASYLGTDPVAIDRSGTRTAPRPTTSRRRTAASTRRSQ